MKSNNNCHIVKTQPSLDILDTIDTKLTQTRAMLLIGSDADFSSYHPSVQQDYLGVTLEQVEDISHLITQMLE